MTELGVWEPLSVRDVGDLFASFESPWWIAGNWAIDAFLGRESREQGDIDVGVLRRDQLAVREHLGEWDVQAADPPGSLRPWDPGEIVPDTTHQIWCRPNAEAAWGLQLMLDESDGDDWLYRRNPAVFRPLDTLTWQHDGLPYLAVEVQLLYKAGSMSPKNEADFAACLPLLENASRRWLETGLGMAHPGHPWLKKLALP